MKKGFTFRASRVLIVLAVAAAVAVLLVRMKPEEKRAPRVEKGVLVEVVSLKPAGFSMDIETYGTVRPREALKLVAEVNGKLTAIHPLFVEGGSVKRGATLLTIDPRMFKLELDRRKAATARAEAELASFAQEVANFNSSIKIAKNDLYLAKKEFVRLRKLHKKRVVAKTRADKAEQTYLASLTRMQSLENQMALMDPKKKRLESQLAMSRADMEKAALDLEKTEVKAHFDGWITDKTVKLGQYVRVGEWLGGLYKDGEFDTDVNVLVKDLKWLTPLMDSGRIPEAEVRFGGAGSGMSWSGRVVRSKAKMNEKTRTLPFVVEVDADGCFSSQMVCPRPGMFVTVTIRGKTVENVYVLPRHAVHENSTVHLLQGETLRKRKVEVLRTFKDSVYITSGIGESDRIIMTNVPNAIDGMKVRDAGG